jgi:hypothetical protein
VPNTSETIGITANTRAIALRPFGKMSFDLLFGSTNIKRKDKKNTHKLPARKRLLIDTVIAVGGTFGASNKDNEPITHMSVIGAKNIPSGIVTHRGKGFGSNS